MFIHFDENSVLPPTSPASNEPRKQARTRIIAAVISLAVISGLLLVVAITSDATSRISLIGSSAWLANNGDDTVSRVDGSKGAVTSRVRGPEGAFSVVQGPDGAFVIDEATGAISKIDGANQRTGTPRTFGTPGGIDVISGPKATYVIDRNAGLVQQVDSAALTPVGSRIELRTAISSGVVDNDGVAWLATPEKGAVAKVVRGASTMVPVGNAGGWLNVAKTNDIAVAIDLAGSCHFRRDAFEVQQLVVDSRVGVAQK